MKFSPTGETKIPKLERSLSIDLTLYRATREQYWDIYPDGTDFESFLEDTLNFYYNQTPKTQADFLDSCKRAIKCREYFTTKYGHPRNRTVVPRSQYNKNRGSRNHGEPCA